TFKGAMPVSVTADPAGAIVIRQETEEGGAQSIRLEPGQAEHLASWLQGYLNEAKEDLTES
ncbi:MAG TPA: hypothetical protein VKA64_07815, partial [Gammaproteobacteria bacterium]|nr:hypothetical protein [Gammaproteobacteria bacterium]